MRLTMPLSMARDQAETEVQGLLSAFCTPPSFIPQAPVTTVPQWHGSMSVQGLEMSCAWRIPPTARCMPCGVQQDLACMEGCSALPVSARNGEMPSGSAKWCAHVYMHAEFGDM